MDPQASQKIKTISLSFLLIDPIVFESYYPRETSRDSNGQAHFTGGEEDMMMRRCDKLTRGGGN